MKDWDKAPAADLGLDLAPQLGSSDDDDDDDSEWLLLSHRLWKLEIWGAVQSLYTLEGTCTITDIFMQWPLFWTRVGFEAKWIRHNQNSRFGEGVFHVMIWTAFGKFVTPLAMHIQSFWCTVRKACQHTSLFLRILLVILQILHHSSHSFFVRIQNSQHLPEPSCWSSADLDMMKFVHSTAATQEHNQLIYKHGCNIFIQTITQHKLVESTIVLRYVSQI